jgi:hypothetical protein
MQDFPTSYEIYIQNYSKVEREFIEYDLMVRMKMQGLNFKTPKDAILYVIELHKRQLVEGLNPIKK